MSAPTTTTVTAATARRAARQMTAAWRRRWWLVALVFALVAALALARYIRAAGRAPYVSSQTLMVEALPPESGATPTVAASQALADQATRALVYGHTLSMLPFLSSVLTQVDSVQPQIAAHAGANPASPLFGVFTATHDGDRVTLSARWSTPSGARSLAQAAGAVLSANPTLVTLLDNLTVPDGTTLRILPIGDPSAPVRDPAALAAARTALAATLALGLLAALALALAADAALAWRRQPDDTINAPTDQAPLRI